MNRNLKFVLFLIVFFAWIPFTLIAMEVRTIEGASKYSVQQNMPAINTSIQDTENQKISIYGGFAGEHCSSDDMDNENTCSNCNQSFTTCNEQRIYPQLKVRITFTIDSEVETGILSFTTDEGNKSITISDKSETLIKDTELFIETKWADLCSALSGDSTCASTFHKSASLGIKESSDAEVFEEKVSIDVYLVTGQENQEFHSSCSSKDPKNNEGICHFSAFPGDKKVFIENIKSPNTFPQTSQSGVYFEYLRVYYNKGSSDSSPNANAFSAIIAPLKNIPFQDLKIDRTSKALNTNTITGLENGFWYYFRIASIDEAGKHFLFFT